MRPILLPLLAAFALAAALPLADPGARAQGIAEIRVSFAPGAESATVEDSLTGQEVVDYLLRARAGQLANISLAARSGSLHFNLIPPGAEQWEAVFVGAREGRQFEGVLDRSGDWRVRVYQMGQAADGGETHPFRLEMIVAADGAGGTVGGEPAPPDWAHAAPEEGGPRRWRVTASGGLRMHSEASVAAPVTATLPEGTVLSNLGCVDGPDRVWCDVQPFRGGARGWVAAEYLAPAIAPHGAALFGADDSAARAGRGEFDATAPHVPCARNGGPLAPDCELGVARAGGGDATVVVTFPDGFRRALFFSHGEFVSADASEAAGGFDIDWSKDAGGTYRIRVDGERYEFPEAMIFGG